MLADQSYGIEVAAFMPLELIHSREISRSSKIFAQASKIESNSDRVFRICFSCYPVIFVNIPRIIKESRKCCHFVDWGSRVLGQTADFRPQTASITSSQCTLIAIIIFA